MQGRSNQSGGRGAERSPASAHHLKLAELWMAEVRHLRPRAPECQGQVRHAQAMAAKHGAQSAFYRHTPEPMVTRQIMRAGWRKQDKVSAKRFAASRTARILAEHRGKVFEGID